MVFAVGFLLLAQAILGPIGALAATIQTDLFIYQNGDVVTVTGDGFGASETVDLVTTDPAGGVVDRGTAATDGAGNFNYQFVLNVTVCWSGETMTWNCCRSNAPGLKLSEVGYA